MKQGNILEECNHVAISSFTQQKQPKLKRPLAGIVQGEASDATLSALTIAVDFRWRVPLNNLSSIGGDMQTAKSCRRKKMNWVILITYMKGEVDS